MNVRLGAGQYNSAFCGEIRALRLLLEYGGLAVYYVQHLHTQNISVNGIPSIDVYCYEQIHSPPPSTTLLQRCLTNDPRASLHLHLHPRPHQVLHLHLPVLLQTPPSV